MSLRGLVLTLVLAIPIGLWWMEILDLIDKPKSGRALNPTRQGGDRSPSPERKSNET